jgi:hypothetical protein
MTTDDYRDALTKWKLRHKAAADFFGITVITSQRYATGERDVPAPMAKLIRLMLALRLTPAKVSEWLGDDEEDQGMKWYNPKTTPPPESDVLILHRRETVARVGRKRGDGDDWVWELPDVGGDPLYVEQSAVDRWAPMPVRR